MCLRVSNSFGCSSQTKIYSVLMLLFAIGTPQYRRSAKLDPEVDAKTKKYGLEVC